MPGSLGLRVAGAVVGGSLATLAATLSCWLNLYWWRSLTLDPASAQRAPPELVSVADAPGPGVVVWVEIAPDGTTSIELGRLPAPEELTIDHCQEADQP